MREPVCEGTSDYYPDTNCSIFYHCINGYPELGYCPNELYFNIELNICDCPMNVPECIRGTRAPLLSTTTTDLTTPLDTTMTITTTTTTTEETTTTAPTTYTV